MNRCIEKKQKKIYIMKMINKKLMSEIFPPPWKRKKE